MRFEQTLTLNVSGYTSGILEQPIKIGSRHSDKPAQDCRPEGRRPQMPADGLSHPLFGAHINLPSSDGDPLGRRGGSGGDHRADRARESREKSASITSGRWYSRAII